MSVKVTFEFANAEEAIIALGKIIGAPTAAAVPPAADKPAEKKERRPRADKGQPREPYGPRTTEAAGASAAPGQGAGSAGGASTAVGTAGNSTPGTTDAGKATAQAATPTSTTPVAPGGAAQPAAPSTTAPAAPVADAVVQAAVERLFNAKGFEDCAALLSRFGVKRGKDLPEDQRANFIRRVDGVIAGEAI